MGKRFEAIGTDFNGIYNATGAKGSLQCQRMDFLKTVTGKVVGGLVTLAVIAAGISWWRMDEATKHTLLAGTGHIVSWVGIVLLVPWATFFIIGWVAKFESNAAGG